MSLIILPKTVRVLLLLSLTALLLFIVIVGWETNERIDSETNQSDPVAANKSQNLSNLSNIQVKKEKKVNLPPAAAPQQQAQKNIAEKSLKPANKRSWPGEVYVPQDDPYRISEELQQILKISGADKSSDLQRLGERASRISTDLALELLGQIPSRLDQQAFLKGILSQLLSFSPSEAVVWTDQYLTNDMKEAAFGFIGELYAMQDPAEAANWAYGIENPALRLKTYESIALVWGANDLNSAYDWALLLEDYGEQSRIFLKLGEALAADNPTGAAEWALTFEDQALGNKILTMALNKWALGGLPEAAQWTSELPEGMYKTFAVSQIGSIWAQINPSASFDWAYAMPYGEARDLALSTITNIWSRNNPKSAADRALAVEDYPLRLKTLEKVLNIWRGKDSLAPTLWAEMIQDPGKRREVEQLLQQQVPSG